MSENKHTPDNFGEGSHVKIAVTDWLEIKRGGEKMAAEIDQLRTALTAAEETTERQKVDLAEAIGLLSVARCPNCDGGWTMRSGDQCQWCDVRSNLLAPQPQGGEG